MNSLGIRLFIIAAVVTGLLACNSNQTPAISPEGLELVKSTAFDTVYRKPGVDLGQYQRVKLNDCSVSFSNSWLRQQKTAGRSATRLSNDDIARIQNSLATQCRESFETTLQADSAYPLTTESGAHVLDIRPAIVDVYINAPDSLSAGRSTSYTTSEGSMRLVLEVFDSQSNEILGRVIDKRKARNNGDLRWTNSLTNKIEAKRILDRWSTILRDMLNSLSAS